MSEQSFDLVVMGVGMAGLSAARKCADAGWTVAVVDHLPYGGTCALRGCDPKKMLRRGAEIIDAARLMYGKGIELGGLHIVWSDLMAFKRSFTGEMPAKVENGLDAKGVTTFHGQARFVGEGSVEIDSGDRLRGRHFLIATGAVPRPIEAPGAEHLTDSTAFLELEELPRRILFVGGGFVSFEFAHIAARAGSEVTIIDRGSRPLKGFDPDLVEKLVLRGEAAEIALLRDSELASISKIGDTYEVELISDGQTRIMVTDLVVHGAGRIPALNDLCLAKAGVAASERGVVVNEFLQSASNPRVYAAGDAADTEGAPLTPVAVFEGKIAASNMLKGNRTIPDYSGVPSTVFTIPELVRVGMLESEARDAGEDFRVAYNETAGWYSNRRVGENCAFTKVIIQNKTEKILGAHLLGPEYAEIVNFFALAIKLGLTTRDLSRTVTAYPTVGSDVGSML